MYENKIELSIIIPVYEELHILGTATHKLNVAKRLGIPFEIIIIAHYKVLGLCNTFAKALSLINIDMTCIDENRGKGYNVFEGVERAKGKYILYIDADDDIDPKIIKALYERIKKGDCDMVYANKYNNDSIVDRSRFRNFGSKIINMAIHKFFDIDIVDTQTGAKIYKADIIKTIAQMRRARIDGFAFEVENAILLKKLGAKVCDVPVKIRAPKGSSVNFSTVFQFFKDLKRLKDVYYKR